MRFDIVNDEWVKWNGKLFNLSLEKYFSSLIGWQNELQYCVSKLKIGNDKSLMLHLLQYYI